MRDRWMWNIRQLLLSVWSDGIAMPSSLSHITTESQWRSLILTVGGDYWHVYMSKKTADGKNTVQYLDRYLKKPPIAGSRLAHYAGGATLSFGYHDHNTGEQATETLTQREIVSLLEQHIPEKFLRYGAVLQRSEHYWSSVPEYSFKNWNTKKVNWLTGSGNCCIEKATLL